ncbi:MAG: hypothetical protein J2O47_03375, partial [Acidimicrobiaceae bacterium]|nr:hypothetical protein [Acidimicrobiaceae bacterium]
MSKVWYCVNCGYEVKSRGRCHSCRERLQLSPLPELEVGDEDDEVGYRLDDWEDAARGRLIQGLIDAGIRHRFEDDELVVAADDEERVDDLVEEAAETAEEDDDFREIHLVEDVFVSDKDRAETYVPGIGLVDAHGRPLQSAGRPHYAISTLERDELEELTVQVRRLRVAARRLRVDPTDMEADGDVAEASAAVFVTDQFPGLNTDTWEAVGRTTRRLLGALGSEEALEDEISRQAGILSVLLDLIADERAEAEASGSAAGGLSEAIGGGSAGGAASGGRAPVGGSEMADQGSAQVAYPDETAEEDETGDHPSDEHPGAADGVGAGADTA